MSKDSALTNFELNPPDANIMVRFVGELNENLKFIEKTFNVKIYQNGNQIKIQGSKKDITLSEDALKRLYATAGQGIEITKETLHLCIQDLNMEKDSHEIVIKTPKKSIIPRSRNQKIFLNNITDNEINFGIGPAGTGKTYLAVAAAVDALLKEKVDRIILIRPAVEAGEKLGFLPGDLSQKVDPYLRPLYDALYEMLGIEKTEKFLIRGIIEIAPLAYMRGRTLNNSFIIVDESQNTTKEQMKMILTRMGFGSNLVINGDLTQVDLPKNIKSGLSHAIEVINGTDGIGFTTFESVDVVRHPLVKKIIDAYKFYEDKWVAK
jgi:phosphate starvation-inducible PhoH-like protein